MVPKDTEPLSAGHSTAEPRHDGVHIPLHRLHTSRTILYVFFFRNFMYVLPYLPEEGNFQYLILCVGSELIFI